MINLSLASTLKKVWFSLKTLSLPMILRSGWYNIEKTHAELKYTNPMAISNNPLLWLKSIQQSRQSKPQPPPFSDFNKPGAVQAWQQKGSTLTLTCRHASIQIKAISAHIIQVRLNQHGIFNTPFSYATDSEAPPLPPPGTTLIQNKTTLTFKTNSLTVQIQLRNSAIDFLDSTGQPVNLDSGGLGWYNTWVGIERTLPQFCPVFGLGERAAPLNLRGQTYQTWNRDPGGHFQTGSDPLYQCHPWFISLYQKQAFGIFFDNPHYGLFDMGKSQPNFYTITAAAGELLYYFIYGPEITTVLQQFTNLTGKMDLPPLWALGLHQSRWSYMDEAEVRTIATEYRTRRIPADVIHLDIHHLQDYQIFTWNKRRFPAPSELVKDLKEQGFRLITIVDPGVKADRLNPLAEQGLAHNVFLKFPDDTVFHGPVWPGDCYFPDFTNPTVRIWWGEQYRTMVDAGIAGFWNDMNEPAVFSAGDSTLPDSVLHNFEGKQATHAQMHNVYGMQMVRATQQAIKALRPNKRPFVLSRSGFSGIQRYAATWTGDNESTWEHLGLSISMVLNLGLSGVAFCGPDIGGFNGSPTPELFARWIELAALFPLCRIHTAQSTPRQEPWSFGAEAEAIARKMIELRYRLLPYLYTAFRQTSQTGIPVIRPMFLAFQNDLYTHSLTDQFMIGDALLAAPILTPATNQRSVYLPKDSNWFDYQSGEYYAGGQTITVAAPLDHLPLFAKAGSVIPQWPPIQHTDEAATLDAIYLYVFAGEGNSILYEDDGQSLNYLQGHSQTIHYKTRFDHTCLTVTARSDGEYTRMYQTIYWLVYLPQTIVPVTIIDDTGATVPWQPTEIPHTITLKTPPMQRLVFNFQSSFPAAGNSM